VATPTWDELLAAVAAGGQRLVLETAGGARAVLVSERELAALEAAAAGRPEAPTLSRREVEVLALVAAGCTGAEIAAQLGLATNTVAQHLASARRRLGVRSSAAAVEAARRAGLLPDPPAGTAEA
jgi:DNA-binding CsgD family transcriptional regulator